jgi:DNA replication protein DnaC
LRWNFGGLGLGGGENKHVTMRTHLARFPFVKSLETFDFSYQPSLDKKQI